MNERLLKARRVLAVQILFDRLADWRLRDLERQELALQESRRDLVRFLDGESAFTGIFAATVMRRMQSLEDLRVALIAEKEAQASLRLDERSRLRRAERIVDALDDHARRAEEARRLAEAVERSVNGKT
ncbi:hypothetical protein RZS28_12660 [Methylocapsa polymorpha]|uniref:Flagellar FliJ protein n=1 Tax=Methylocapsa polymorpha TaxID=3080828 RepID=A0ABZ0HNB7_9HYPH|nr:hypothetical protein RZS28_12660 [Methylocapsa sp. RX1]